VVSASTIDFDASTVDPDTVSFAGAQPLRWTLEDVDGDGEVNLLFHFKIRELDLDTNSIEAFLDSMTDEGEWLIWGKDTVEIVPKGK
jgi:hypothetical protein